jgi:hypothetical protein
LISRQPLADQVPDNLPAIWTLQRLIKAPKLSAAALKAFQAVPIANAALWIKCSSQSVKGAKRDAVAALKVPYMVDEFWKSVKAAFTGCGIAMPSWVEVDDLKYTTLKSKCQIGSNALVTATLYGCPPLKKCCSSNCSANVARTIALTHRYKSHV